MLDLGKKWGKMHRGEQIRQLSETSFYFILFLPQWEQQKVRGLQRYTEQDSIAHFGLNKIYLVTCTVLLESRHILYKKALNYKACM